MFATATVLFIGVFIFTFHFSKSDIERNELGVTIGQTSKDIIENGVYGQTKLEVSLDEIIRISQMKALLRLSRNGAVLDESCKRNGVVNWDKCLYNAGLYGDYFVEEFNNYLASYELEGFEVEVRDEIKVKGVVEIELENGVSRVNVDVVEDLIDLNGFSDIEREARICLEQNLANCNEEYIWETKDLIDFVVFEVTSKEKIFGLVPVVYEFGLEKV